MEKRGEFHNFFTDSLRWVRPATDVFFFSSSPKSHIQRAEKLSIHVMCDKRNFPHEKNEGHCNDNTVHGRSFGHSFKTICPFKKLNGISAFLGHISLAVQIWTSKQLKQIINFVNKVPVANQTTVKFRNNHHIQQNMTQSLAFLLPYTDISAFIRYAFFW